MMNKKGFTLVEILIVMAVLSVFVIAVVSAMDPMGSMAKARDAERKRDLNKIKTAFEDYLNDKNCYPDQSLVNSMMSIANCGGSVFSPWISVWPCDPKKVPYYIVVGDDGSCPKWYKVMTALENKDDPQISDQGGLGAGSPSPVNYGVSSGNVSNDK